MNTQPYRIEENKKIGKYQIKVPAFNVAIAEFYDNSASSRKEIGAMLSACAGIDNPEEAIAKAREALKLCLQSFERRKTTHVLSGEDQRADIAVINALAALTPKP